MVFGLPTVMMAINPGGHSKTTMLHPGLTRGNGEMTGLLLKRDIIKKRKINLGDEEMAS